MDQALKNQIAGMLRIIVPVALAWLVGKGILKQEDVGETTENVIQVCVALITVGSLIWSFWRNTEVKQIENVAKMDSVKKVVAEEHIADGALKDNDKVTTR